mmetsp:Transcript_43818/g.124090  ORF Transcript_43818/g.124090 Transcript_43818/m.124090 type:complete len:202 (+) Transcript_43818:1399-2004(+)
MTLSMQPTKMNLSSRTSPQHGVSSSTALPNNAPFLMVWTVPSRVATVRRYSTSYRPRQCTKAGVPSSSTLRSILSTCGLSMNMMPLCENASAATTTTDTPVGWSMFWRSVSMHEMAGSWTSGTPLCSSAVLALCATSSTARRSIDRRLNCTPASRNFMSWLNASSTPSPSGKPSKRFQVSFSRSSMGSGGSANFMYGCRCR